MIAEEHLTAVKTKVPDGAKTGKGKKKIVICCDGTGNEFSAPNVIAGDAGSGQNSNVVKLYTALEVDNEQVAYYHPGVGTMGSPNAAHWWSKEWSRIKGLAFGAGFRDNVLDAYRYLMEVYSDNGGDGDEVYIFGFSRGAYTARALAGLLHGYGLLCKGNEGHLPYAWRMYVAQHDSGTRDRRFIQPDVAFRKTFSHKNFKIHFVGVWDTVSSVGWISSPLRLLNLAENDTIVRARHAISIDEHRCFFENNLWADKITRAIPELNPANDPTPPNEDKVQVWFAGVHSDVGGSYRQTESGMAYITLEWMLNEARDQPGRPGIRLNAKRLARVFGDESPGDYAELAYTWPPEVEQPTLPWMTKHTSLKGGWWLLEFIPHLYFNMDNGREQYRVPLGVRLRELPKGSLVHPSVVERMNNAALKYAPKNVRLEELVPCSPAVTSEGGDEYYCFAPKGRTPHSKLFNWFDRYVVTWFFTIFDIVIFVPFLLWLLAMLLVLVFKVGAWIGYGTWLALSWIWGKADQSMPKLTHCIAWVASGAGRAIVAFYHAFWRWFTCWFNSLWPRSTTP